jgi:hypothetical protein
MRPRNLVLPFWVVILLSSLIFEGTAFSQVSIEVKTTLARMSKGMQPCYIVEIPQVALEDVQENWIKKLQENIKVKVAEAEYELVLAKVFKSEISPDTITIYTLFIEKDSNIVMNVFVEIDSVFFSPVEDETNLSAQKTDSGLKKYIRDFAVSQYRLSATADLENEQNVLEEMQAEYDKLEKENEDLEKDISTMQNEIEKTDRKIIDLESDIALKNKEISTHSTGMLDITGEEERKAAETKRKDLEKERNKMEKERTNYKNDISDMEAKIKKNEKTIEENITLLEQKQEEINLQTEQVKKAQAFLDGIK